MTNAVPIGDAAELTRYIETRYHPRHRVQLPQLVLLAELIKNRHQGGEGSPEGLSDRLCRMSGKTDVQMKEEKRILFPAVRKRATSGTKASIAVMRINRDGYEAHPARCRLHKPGGALCGSILRHRRVDEPPTACERNAFSSMQAP